MKKTDEVDRALASAYAWKILRPGESLVEDEGTEETAGEAAKEAETNQPEEQESETEERSPADLESLRAHAFRETEAIAKGVDSAWMLQGSELCEAVSELLLRAEKLGIGFAAMQHFPRESVRLFRLAVRCMDELADEAHEAASKAALWAHLDHPELVDLLVEIAIAGEKGLGGTLAFALHPSRADSVARVPGATERFAKLLDEGPSFVTRRLALDWLWLAAKPSAAPALRRALRLPHFAIRFRAFEMLSRKLPSAIEAGDLLFLLNEAVCRTPPETSSNREIAEAKLLFPELIHNAVVRLRPPGGAAPLLDIERGHCARTFYRLNGFDQSWALTLLAAAYPQEALPIIDELMLHVEWDRRFRAVEAASALPDELAWPRLLALAADGVPRIASYAQAIWLKRKNELCPLDKLAGIEKALLPEPPDERFFSRLSVLRTAPLEARAAMVEVLLKEAPDPAALALILFALGDSALWDTPPRPALPRSRAAYCSELVQRFGAPAVTGICAMDERYPKGRWGFFHAVGEIATKGLLPEQAFSVAQKLATKRLLAAHEAGISSPLTCHTALQILSTVGLPPETYEHVFAISRDANEESYVRAAAASALATLPLDSGALRDSMEQDLRESLARADHEGAKGPLLVGLLARIPAFIEAAVRLLEDLGPLKVGPALSLVETAAQELEGLSRLPPDWHLRALQTPGTNAFCAAARRLSSLADPLAAALYPAAEPYLLEAYASSDPVSSAEAAVTLVRRNKLDAHSQGIETVLAAASPELKADLLNNLLYVTRKGAERKLWPWLSEVLVSPDRRVTKTLRYSFVRTLAESADIREDLLPLLPRIIDSEVRAELEERLHEDQPETYWQDAADDDDDDDDDEFEDDEEDSNAEEDTAGETAEDEGKTGA